MKRSRDLEEEVDSPPADENDLFLEPVRKVVGLDIESPNDESHNLAALQCSMPGHLPGLSFETYIEYETHYNKAHTNRCLECCKNFPSSHYVDLHIAECHDALVAIKKDKGEAVYACFVETCSDKFQTFQRRKKHLIKSHMFPSNYFFAITKYGIDQRRSLLGYSKGEKHRNKTHASTTHSAEDDERPVVTRDATIRTEGATDAGVADHHESANSQGVGVDTDMEDLTEVMSTMKFVPRTVRFGPKQRMGFARR